MAESFSCNWSVKEYLWRTWPGDPFSLFFLSVYLFRITLLASTCPRYCWLLSIFIRRELSTVTLSPRTSCSTPSVTSSSLTLVSAKNRYLRALKLTRFAERLNTWRPKVFLSYTNIFLQSNFNFTYLSSAPTRSRQNR